MSSPEILRPTLPVLVLRPATTAIALVCDSPHSGTDYPPDFGYAVATAELRNLEDTHVHWLWDAVPRVGGTLVHATFARSYIDPNRSEHDIDVAMLADAWPGGAAPAARTLALGNGLVSSHTPTRQPIYARRLPAREVAHRIEHYWRPYRSVLTQALEATAQGPRWHLNLHSMPSNAYERLGRVAPGPLADVVLGDLNGQSCSAAFTELVAGAFRQRGYSVAVNDPYAGQDLVRKFGMPSRRHESLQIELNRALYLDEQTRERLPRAPAVREDITGVLREIATYIRHATPASPIQPLTTPEEE
jgi:N-formylglutamate deformylase